MIWRVTRWRSLPPSPHCERGSHIGITFHEAWERIAMDGPLPLALLSPVRAAIGAEEAAQLSAHRSKDASPSGGRKVLQKVSLQSCEEAVQQLAHRYMTAPSISPAAGKQVV